MTERDNAMTDRETAPEVSVINPRYQGATPEDVGRALLRPSEDAPACEPDDDEDAEAA